CLCVLLEDGNSEPNKEWHPFGLTSLGGFTELLNQLFPV
nr:hypothetical protein [Tanacetum cinerariifolium]